jgi:acetyltransferase-like isoleucine patch superfamily enzyme
MAQHLLTPPPLLTGVCRVLSEWITPNAHIPWRWELKNKLMRKVGVTLGQGVAIDNGFEWLIEGGRVIVEECAVIGRNVHLYNFSDIRIGKFSMLAGEILIANGGHDKDSFVPFSGPITIGHGVWIGTGVKIVGANVSIGNNAIIGAGTLVINDVPPCAIVAGVPAKVIGYRNLPEKVWHLGNTWFSPHTFEQIED